MTLFDILDAVIFIAPVAAAAGFLGYVGLRSVVRFA